MTYLVSLLIGALCLYLVIIPLLKPKMATKKVSEVDFEDISLKNVYATLNELEMDYNMKKLSDEDYNKLKNEYEKLAAELLSEEKQEETKAKMKVKTKGKASKNSDQDPDLDQSQTGDIEAEIEAELAQLRRERGERE